MIPYSRQNITQEDVNAVLEVLNSDFLTQGPKVTDFEQAITKEVNAKYAIAVNSATSALHIACMALDLGPGDWFWTTPITFVATANCGLYCGAKIDFVDIEPLTYNISVPALTEKLKKAEKNGTLPKVIIAVHFAGQSCDMESLYSLSKTYGFHIIEDASHALGGKYNNSPVGSCRYSDITVFSFHPVKIITTGEGGIAVSNNPNLAEKMQMLQMHGITRNSKKMVYKAEGEWYYEQHMLGHNYRMSDIQASLGLSQLKRLDHFIKIRQQLASVYHRALMDLPLIRPFISKNTVSAYHLYVVKVDQRRSLIDRNTLFNEMRKAGIGVQIHYIPVHLQPFYEKKGFKRGDFPEAEKYYNNALSLPLYPDLQKMEQNFVINMIKKYL